MGYPNNYSTYEDDAFMMAEMRIKLIEAVEDAIVRDYELSANVEHNKVLKTNVEVDALQVHFQNSNIAPSIYLDAAYEQYKNGSQIEDIAADIAKAAVMAHRQSPIVPELTAEEAKKAVTLTLINRERNEKLLQNVPYFTVGDLAAVPRWYISEEASFLVTNDLVSTMMLTGDEILQIGQQNINNTKFDVVSMPDMLKGLFVGNDMERVAMDELVPETTETPMLVMTSRNRLQGARAILSKDALAEVTEKLHGKEFYILPSSVHEVICIPADAAVSPAYLGAMVREVNAVEVSPQEFLSNEVMKFDGNKISLVRDELKPDSPGVNERTIHYAGMRM